MKLWHSIVENDFNSDGLLNILNEAISKNANEVVLLAETEWQTPGVYDAIVNLYKQNNIKLTIIYCSVNSPYYEKFCRDSGLDMNDLHFWPTYWLSWSLENLTNTKVYGNNNIDSSKIIHPYISLNNRSHLHRCVFIDELAKQNLIESGVVTWVKHLNENAGYPYKHFDNRQLTLDDDFKTKLDSFMLPKEFYESLFHVVTEATHVTGFISEKTAIPLFMKKPFFVLSAPHYQKHLDDLGFKRYDEIIDYSYDDIEDLELRTEKFVENIHRFKNMNLTEVYELLRPKLEYNHNRALELTRDPKQIPDLIKERYEYVVQHGCEFLTDRRYIKFVNDSRNPLCLDIWSDTLVSDIENLEHNSNGINRVILNAVREYNYHMIGGRKDLMDSLIQSTDRSDIHLDIITCSHPGANLLSDYPHVHVHYWPTFWLTLLLMRLKVSPNYQMNQAIGMDVEKLRVNEHVPLKHSYISMNKAPKIHRAMMMDMLAKYDLIDRGVCIWREPVQGYQYKYWSEQIMLRDQVDGFRYQEQLPLEYAVSFMQIVPESDEEVFCLSEKTGMALYFNKPFLVLGCMNFHKTLESLGFKLYDELFDYSFDSEPDTLKRCEMIAQNVQKYADKTPEELKELYKSVFEKCVYNKKVAIELAINQDLIPGVWQDLVESQLKNNIADYPEAINNFIKTTKHEFRL